MLPQAYLGSIVPISLVTTTVLGIITVAFLYRNLYTAKTKLPPGPPCIPILGNLRQWLQAKRTSTGLSNWLLSQRVHGEMTTLHMGSQTWILLNSSRVVHEIIAKRGSITHERPPFPICSDLVSRGQRTVIRQTARWTEGRRVMHNLLSNSAELAKYGEWIELESLQLIYNYMHSPKRWYAHNFRYANSVVHRIVLGHRLLKSTPELDDFQRVGMQFIRSINASWVDFFPWFARLPRILQPWRRKWRVMGDYHYYVFSRWWDPVKKAVTDGSAPASFVRDTLLSPDTKYKGSDEEAMYLAMSVIGAGSDNPRLAMNTFLMATLCHPEIMDTARDEIDAVCGIAQRLPVLYDVDKMPFTCALIKEVLRWRPLMPFVPQHRLTQDLDFEDYHFPEGTDFVINFAAVSQAMDDAKEFRPKRWLDDEQYNIVRDLWQFGGGRRVCVGYKIAQQELFLAISRLLCCFEFEAAGWHDSRLLNHHMIQEEPFLVGIKPRSQVHEELIWKEASKAGLVAQDTF